MSNNSQGHALAEGQDLEAKFQFQSQSQSDPDSEAQRQQINRELSHFNIKLEADTLKSANLVDKSFEFALNCVLSHSDSTKDEIESLFRQNYQPPLDPVLTSIVIAIFDGDDKLGRIYKRSSILPPPKEQFCGFGYRAKTCSLFELKSLNNSNVPSNYMDSVSNKSIGLNAYSQEMLQPNTSNQSNQENYLQFVFNLLYQHQTLTFTCIEMNHVNALVKLKAEFPESSIDALVEHYFESNSRFLDSTVPNPTQFELKKPRGDDVIEFIQNHPDLEPDKIFRQYETHLKNRQQYSCLMNAICHKTVPNGMWLKMFLGSAEPIQYYINQNNFSDSTIDFIQKQMDDCRSFLQHPQSSFNDAEIFICIKRLEAFIEAVKKSKVEEVKKSNVKSLIASMTESFHIILKTFDDSGFDLSSLNLKPRFFADFDAWNKLQPTNDKASAEYQQIIKNIQTHAAILPIGLGEAYSDLKVIRGLGGKIKKNDVKDQDAAYIRPEDPESGAFVWKVYQSDPFSDLHHIVPWRKALNGKYYRPADAATGTHCVVAAMAWSEWSDFEKTVTEAEHPDGVVSSSNFDHFQQRRLLAAVHLLPNLLDVCDKIFAHGTTYDYNNIIYAGYSHNPNKNEKVKKTFDELIEHWDVAKLSQYFVVLFESFDRMAMPGLPSGWAPKSANQCHMVSYKALTEHITAEATLKKLLDSNPQVIDIIPWFELSKGTKGIKGTREKKGTKAKKGTKDYFDSLARNGPTLFNNEEANEETKKEKLKTFANSFCKFVNFLVKDGSNLRLGNPSVNSSIKEHFDMYFAGLSQYTPQQMNAIFNDFIQPSLNNKPQKTSILIVQAKTEIQIFGEAKTFQAKIEIVKNKEIFQNGKIWVATSDLSPFYYYSKKGTARSCLPVDIKKDKTGLVSLSRNNDWIEENYGLDAYNKFTTTWEPKKQWPNYP